MTRQGPSLLVQTPAKLNLSLHVLGPRQDGYHNLQSLMVSVRLYDTLVFSPIVSNQVRLANHTSRRVSAPPDDERNLILRAAEQLKAETGQSRGVSIRLIKRIPQEAGLGGGSSDAAAALVSLNQFWNLELPPSRLHQLAARLGSDVNFFLDSHHAALCTGRGEQIHPVPLRRPLWFVVLKPRAGLSTGRVFSEFHRLAAETVQDCPPENHTDIAAEHPLSARQSLRQIADMGGNDLQPAAAQLSQDVSDCLDKLSSSSGITSGLTGSGSACFALCRSRRQAAALAGRLRARQREDVYVVKSGV